MIGSQHNLNFCQDKVSAVNTLQESTNMISDLERQIWLNVCQLPCEQIVYDVKIKKFHLNNLIDTDDTEQFSNDVIILKLAYDSFIIEERVESLFYDSASFLVAVGGNLGLFLGFSCFSVLLGLIKLLKNIIKAKKVSHILL